MKILITGNLGYVGTVLTDVMVKNNYKVIGYDIGYFRNCLISKEGLKPHEQIIGDIRNFDKVILKDIDAVIHLAALSNDPLGEFDTAITKEINQIASINLAYEAKLMNVKKFINISTQSLYGISKVNEDLDEYDSEKNPITSYAITKYEAEKEIIKLNSENFQVVSLRPATVYGYSPRFRSDIVFNSLLLNGMSTKNILIKSDGTPIRPIVHINDLSNVILQSLKNKKNIFGNCYNVGYPGGNFTVTELAEAAAKVIEGSKITYSKNFSNDERTYSISFNRIKKDFHNINLNYDLVNDGKRMVEIFNKLDLKKIFNDKKLTIRLEQLKFLKDSKKLNKNLELI